jgi:hypothetical protein|nr:MAG TPA: hypothetical protein [Bacteriophage sp.]
MFPELFLHRQADVKLANLEFQYIPSLLAPLV